MQISVRFECSSFELTISTYWLISWQQIVLFIQQKSGDQPLSHTHTHLTERSNIRSYLTIRDIFIENMYLIWLRNVTGALKNKLYLLCYIPDWYLSKAQQLIYSQFERSISISIRFSIWCDIFWLWIHKPNITLHLAFTLKMFPSWFYHEIYALIIMFFTKFNWLNFFSSYLQ